MNFEESQIRAERSTYFPFSLPHPHNTGAVYVVSVYEIKQLVALNLGKLIITIAYRLIYLVEKVQRGIDLPSAGLLHK